MCLCSYVEGSGNQTRRHLDDKLALMYGNACNGILRAMACAYQKVVLNRDYTYIAHTCTFDIEDLNYTIIYIIFFL